MKRAFFAFGMSVFCVSAALAAPVAPGRGQLAGDIIQMNQQFHVDYYNFRIQKLQWIPGDSPLATTLVDKGVTIDEGKGVLMIFAAVKSTAAEGQPLPMPVMQAVFKDGSQSVEDSRSAYTATGKEMSGDYQPGQGASVVYFIESVAQPTADNPITKLIIKPHNGGDNDSGAPKIFRMLNPPVISP